MQTITRIFATFTGVRCSALLGRRGSRYSGRSKLCFPPAYRFQQVVSPCRCCKRCLDRVTGKREQVRDGKAKAGGKCILTSDRGPNPDGVIGIEGHSNPRSYEIANRVGLIGRYSPENDVAGETAFYGDCLLRQPFEDMGIRRCVDSMPQALKAWDIECCPKVGRGKFPCVNSDA